MTEIDLEKKKDRRERALARVSRCSKIHTLVLRGARQDKARQGADAILSWSVKGSFAHAKEESTEQ